MEKKFDNSSILITGGASGIGAAVASKVLSLGATPILVDLNLDQLKKTSEELKLNGSFSVGDVTDENSLIKVLDFIQNKFPPLKGLVCSAGKAPIPKKIEDTSLNEWNSIIESHLTGTFLSCKVFGCQMVKSGYGSIVNVSSVLAHNPGPVLAYGVAKSGILNLTSSLSVQWSSKNVRVNAVAPGWTDTPLLRPKERGHQRDLQPILSAVPQNRLMKPEEIADVISFLLSPSSSSITGSVINCDGGTLAGSGWPPYGGFPKKTNDN